MSTKVYDFYRIDKSFPEIMSWLKDFRKKYWEYRIEDLTRWVSKKTTIIDFANVLHKASDGFDRSPYALDSWIGLYFFEDHFYLKFFNVPYELQEDEPDLIDAYYQDQSDKPKNITKKEWNERARVVDAIFGDERMDSPGLLYLLVDKADSFDIASKTLSRAKERG